MPGWNPRWPLGGRGPAGRGKVGIGTGPSAPEGDVPRLLTLTGDGSLALELDPLLAGAASPWLPGGIQGLGPPRAEAARLRLAVASPPLPGPPPLLHPGIPPGPTVGEAVAVPLAPGRPAPGSTLHTSAGWWVGVPARGGGLLDAAGGTFLLDRTIPSGPLGSLLTLATALLLLRRGRTLVHAGAVEVDGGAWLVVGDSGAGKTTTCLSMACSGGLLLSDDQVILFGGGSPRDVPQVEGWLRPAHLDTGWDRGSPTGRRVRVLPSTRGASTAGAGRRVPVMGMLVPRVSPSASTRLTPLPASEGFIHLVRQAPWLAAGGEGSAAVMELLRGAALAGSFRLTLGLDTFGRPGELTERIREGISRGGRPLP